MATGFGNKPADEEEALKLEAAAAEGGSIAAALGLAFRFLHGVEGVVEPDCGKALEIYKVCFVRPSLSFLLACLSIDWLPVRLCFSLLAGWSIDSARQSLVFCWLARRSIGRR